MEVTKLTVEGASPGLVIMGAILKQPEQAMSILAPMQFSTCPLQQFVPLGSFHVEDPTLVFLSDGLRCGTVSREKKKNLLFSSCF